MADEATQEATGEVVQEGVVDESTAGNEKEQQDRDPEGADQLGDPGKKALDAMKADRNAARQQAREFQQQLEDLKAQVEGREQERAAEVEQQRVKDEALAAANERILKAEVRATGASKLADPTDALRFIDLSEFEVGEDGSVDSEAISGAIDSLLKQKPYLAAQGGTGTVFDSPGAHRDSVKGQVTESELKNMTPDQINAARAEGRLNDLLGIKN